MSRDVLLLTRIDKPALLRRLFALGCEYSGQELSYRKMIGQLTDAGNTTTLAHYLDLLAGTGLVTGLQKHWGRPVQRRSSSPKLLVMNTALMTALSGARFEEARADSAFWGRIVETALGRLPSLDEQQLHNRSWGMLGDLPVAQIFLDEPLADDRLWP